MTIIYVIICLLILITNPKYFMWCLFLVFVAGAFAINPLLGIGLLLISAGIIGLFE